MRTRTARTMALAACLAAAACRPAGEGPVEVTHAIFGVYRTPHVGRTEFEPTRVVPFAVGQRYGWLIGVKTARPRIRWREELVLPSPPATWGPRKIGSRRIAADNRSIVIEREVTVASGFIVHAWQ